MDNGKLGDFISVGGFDQISMQTEYIIDNLTLGNSYRLRYRVLNYVGWSAFSPAGFALVAVVPSPPTKPGLISAT